MLTKQKKVGAVVKQSVEGKMLFVCISFFMFMYSASGVHSGNKSDDQSMVYAPRKLARTDVEAGTMAASNAGLR